MHRYRIFAFYREKTIREGRIFPEGEDRGRKLEWARTEVTLRDEPLS